MALKPMTPEQIKQYEQTKPRPYDLTNKNDLGRLFRETVGYARVALASGTDTPGRRYAYEALRELHANGWEFLPGHKSAPLTEAAPDLLAALKGVVSAYGDTTWGTAYAMDRALSYARTVIAKAEGDAP